MVTATYLGGDDQDPLPRPSNKTLLQHLIAECGDIDVALSHWQEIEFGSRRRSDSANDAEVPIARCMGFE